MEHFVDPDQRPIEPPTAPVEDTPFLTVDDFPPDSFASSREERHTTGTIRQFSMLSSYWSQGHLRALPNT